LRVRRTRGQHFSSAQSNDFHSRESALTVPASLIRAFCMNPFRNPCTSFTHVEAYICVSKPPPRAIHARNAGLRRRDADALKMFDRHRRSHHRSMLAPLAKSDAPRMLVSHRRARHRSMLTPLAASATVMKPRLRGLHSFTFQLNVSALCEIGGAFRRCSGGVLGVVGGMTGYLECILCEKRLRLSRKVDECKPLPRIPHSGIATLTFLAVK